MNALEVRNVVKYFGSKCDNANVVLNGINMSVASGSM